MLCVAALLPERMWLKCASLQSYGRNADRQLAAIAIPGRASSDADTGGIRFSSAIVEFILGKLHISPEHRKRKLCRGRGPYRHRERTKHPIFGQPSWHRPELQRCPFFGRPVDVGELSRIGWGLLHSSYNGYLERNPDSTFERQLYRNIVQLELHGSGKRHSPTRAYPGNRHAEPDF